MYNNNKCLKEIYYAIFKYLAQFSEVGLFGMYELYQFEQESSR